MASWKKLIVSGSTAELATVCVTGCILPYVDGQSCIGNIACNFQTVFTNNVISSDEGGLADLKLCGTKVVGDVICAKSCFVGNLCGTVSNAVSASLSDTVHVEICTSDDNWKLAAVNGVDGYHTIISSDDGSFPTVNTSTNTITAENFSGTTSVCGGTVYGTYICSAGEVCGSTIRGTYVCSAGAVCGNVVQGNIVKAETGFCTDAYVCSAVTLGSTAVCGGNVYGTYICSAGEVCGSTIRGTYVCSAGAVCGNQIVGNTLDITSNARIGGNLLVDGSFTYINTTNLAVEDKFILLNSGSADPDDAGIVIDQGSGKGHAFAYDSNCIRWGFTGSLDATTGSIVLDGFVATVTSNCSIVEYRATGNIYVCNQTGDIYIWS